MTVRHCAHDHFPHSVYRIVTICPFGIYSKIIIKSRALQPINTRQVQTDRGGFEWIVKVILIRRGRKRCTINNKCKQTAQQVSRKGRRSYGGALVIIK
jgi:hypothetical protein